MEPKNQPEQTIPGFLTPDGFGDQDITEVGDNDDLMNLMMDAFELNMPFQKVEYFRTNRNVLKNADGTTKLSKGIKKGVFLAFVDPSAEESVCIGYSMCHPRDRFDYQRGYKFKGLGLWHACRRAEKYKESTSWRISKHCADKQLPREIVKIPHSMTGRLAHFIARCKLYYKDKKLPAWAENFALIKEVTDGSPANPELPDNTEA
jgi:hypothetical protein